MHTLEWLFIYIYLHYLWIKSNLQIEMTQWEVKQWADYRFKIQYSKMIYKKTLDGRIEYSDSKFDLAVNVPKQQISFWWFLIYDYFASKWKRILACSRYNCKCSLCTKYPVTDVNCWFPSALYTKKKELSGRYVVENGFFCCLVHIYVAYLTKDLSNTHTHAQQTTLYATYARICCFCGRWFVCLYYFRSLSCYSTSMCVHVECGTGQSVAAFIHYAQTLF